jgi:tight adherence protein B
MDLLIAIGIFGLMVALATVLMNGGQNDSKRAADLLEDVTRANVDKIGEGLIRTGGRQTRRRASNRQEELLDVIYRINFLNRLEEQMWQAGLYMRVSEMLLLIVMMFGAGFSLGEFILHDLLMTLAIAFGMSALPLFYIRFRRKRRMREFTLQLPSALDLIKSSIEAGHSLLRGMQVLVQEFAEPLGGEFRTVLE